MKKEIRNKIGFFIVSLSLICIGCEKDSTNISPIGEIENIVEEEVEYIVPDIDLRHWKVTLPIGNPTEIHPPEILNYASNETLKPFMYNDSTDGSLVFYAYPGASTANSTYSRTELRELLDPEDASVNWTFEEGGRMKGKLAMHEMSKDANGNYHRSMVMQIHGRLTNEQRDLISQKDNNAPPILKIYWYNGFVRVKSKVLKDKNASNIEILSTAAWGDDEGFNFEKNVGFEQFELEIIASKGKLEIILNNEESYVIENQDLERWGVFENYFKAGNYFVSKDIGSYAKVKYYTLEVSH